MDKSEKLAIFKYIWHRADRETKEKLKYLLEREAIARRMCKSKCISHNSFH